MQTITAHVLNLKRRPDRREAFLRRCAHDGLRVEMIEAIDGRSLSYGEAVDRGVIDPRANHFGQGCVGAASSHKMMWERCVADARPALILEDDAILRADFVSAYQDVLEQVPPTWDFITFGWNVNSVLEVRVLPHVGLEMHFPLQTVSEAVIDAIVRERAPPTTFRVINFFGLCGYAVSPKGAEKLLRLCFPMRAMAVTIRGLQRTIDPAPTIDWIMNAHYENLEAYCSFPPLVVTPNDTATSDASARNQQVLT